jgi:hypothetical protein
MIWTTVPAHGTRKIGRNEAFFRLVGTLHALRFTIHGIPEHCREGWGEAEISIIKSAPMTFF